MKFIEKVEQGKPVFVSVTWKDHKETCQRCQQVDLNTSATLSLSCALGAPLVAEELIRRQAPIQKEKEREIRDWAERAGVFKL